MRAPQGPSATPAAEVDDDLLRQWPLPQPDGAADKEARGRVLIVGGSTELPGGVVLAAEAALRAGAGKVAVATVRSAAPFVAAALPEARVVALDEDGQGRLAIHAAERLRPLLARTAALLVGPGMPTDDAVLPLVDGLLQALADEAAVVLDAAAMVPVARGAASARGEDRRPWRHDMLLTPHAGEMAKLCGRDKAEVLASAGEQALAAAARWSVHVALKGPVTHLAAPDGRHWRHQGGNSGLGTSGSGDVLAGLIAGLAARGAPLAQAAAWGVALHARAGEALARRIGPLGYLARELPAEVPALMASLGPPPER